MPFNDSWFIKKPALASLEGNNQPSNEHLRACLLKLCHHLMEREKNSEEAGPPTDQEQSIEDAVRGAARVLLGTAFDLIEADSHHFSKHHCKTCSAVSTLIGRPFGCLKFARLGAT